MLRRLTALFLLAALLCGCNATPPAAPDTTAPVETTAPETTLPPLLIVGEGAPTYNVIRADEADRETTEAAVLLYRSLTKLGGEGMITTDWEKNPVSDYELVVGETTRFALDGLDIDLAAYGEEGYFIRAVGARIYLCGGTPAATLAAVEDFVATFLSGASTTPVTLAADYLHTVYEAHPITAITVGGRSLRDFVLAWDDSLDADDAAIAAEHIRRKLLETTGIYLSIAGSAPTDSPTLRLSGKPAATDGGFAMTVEAGDLVLTTAVPGGHTRGFAQFVNDSIRGKEGEISMDTSFHYQAEIGEYVTYSQFGAKGDGKTDDLAAIIATHAYANQKGLEVRADYGATYYIGVADKGATVMTDVDWTGASFILDDSEVGKDKRGVGIFNVVSTKASYKVTDKIKSATRDQTKFDLTLPEDSIIVLTDATTKRYIREGKNANSGSAQTDIVVVDRAGNIDPGAPLIWDYTQVTDATVIPMDEETLTIRGGHFTTIANRLPSASLYYNRGIILRRSNVIVEDIVHDVTGEGSDGCPYSGILVISDCANITVRDCVFTGHKTYKNVGVTGATVSQGTYDITPSRTVNLTFENCRQTNDILDTTYWGIMGSNFCKNITVRDCVFSRFDAHQGVANVTIQGSTLGHQCLNAIGCGTLLVEDSTLYGTSFINLRSDYGSTWEGEAIIRNCTWVPNKGNKITGTHAVFGGSYTGFHDFGYPCYMPANITIDGLHIDDSQADGSYKGIYLLGNITPANTAESYTPDYPYHVPETLTIRNFSSESGKNWQLSPNAYMFRDVKVIEE